MGKNIFMQMCYLNIHFGFKKEILEIRLQNIPIHVTSQGSMITDRHNAYTGITCITRMLGLAKTVLWETVLHENTARHFNEYIKILKPSQSSKVETPLGPLQITFSGIIEWFLMS